MPQGNTLIDERVRRVVGRLGDKADVVAAYVFGSQVDGEPDESSDLDIALFVNNYRWWTIMRQVRVSCKIKEAEGDDLDLHFFDANSLPNPSPATFAGFVVRHGVPIPLPGRGPTTRGKPRTGALSR